MWLAVARLPVVAQSRGTYVLLLAASTLVDPLVRVLPLVQLEVGRPAELLQANIAPMFLCVLLQASRARETLGTNSAFVASFARVNSQMTLETAVMGETFAANEARERLFLRMD